MENEELRFNTIVYDSQLIDGSPQYTFFNDDSVSTEDRAIRLNEEQLIDWLFNKSYGKQTIYEELKIPLDTIHFLSVKNPIIEKPNIKPGDIDVLLCNRNNLKQTIALECKRIKVSFDEDYIQTTNNIEELYKGVEQANGLSELGFYKSYLFVMIITDGQYLKGIGQFFRYPSASPLNAVYYFDGYKNLNENVGVVLCLITQLNGKSIDLSGQICIREHKAAKSQEQPKELTEKILRLIEKY